MQLDWNKMPIRILAAAAPLVEMIEKNHKVVKGTGCSSLVEVLKTIRQARNDFGSSMLLAAAMKSIPTAKLVDEAADKANNGDDDENDSDEEEGGGTNPDQSTLERKRANQPTSGEVYNVLASLIRQLRSLQIVAPWKSQRIEDLSRSLLIPYNVATLQTEYQAACLIFLKTLSEHLTLDESTTNPHLNEKPLFEFFLGRQLDAGKATVSQEVIQVLLHEGMTKMRDNQTVKELWQWLQSMLGLPASKGTSDFHDLYLALAVHFYPLEDLELKQLIVDIILQRDHSLDALLGLFNHPLINLIPMSMSSAANLRVLCSKQAGMMVCRMPQVTIDLAIAQAIEEARPTLRMISNSIGKIVSYALTKSDTSEEVALQSMLQELVGDVLPAPLRPHVSLPILDSLNGPSGLISTVRADMGHIARSTKISGMVKELATAIGTVVFGCNRFITRRVRPVLFSMFCGWGARSCWTLDMLLHWRARAFLKVCLGDNRQCIRSI